MLFSTLKQTHCTHVTCDSESAAFDQPQSVMKFHGCCKVTIRNSETFDQPSFLQLALNSHGSGVLPVLSLFLSAACPAYWAMTLGPVVAQSAGASV